MLARKLAASGGGGAGGEDAADGREDRRQSQQPGEHAAQTSRVLFRRFRNAAVTDQADQPVRADDVAHPQQAGVEAAEDDHPQVLRRSTRRAVRPGHRGRQALSTAARCRSRTGTRTSDTPGSRRR